MRGLSARVVANLAAIALVATALGVWALSGPLAAARDSTGYPLSVALPETGGLVAGQEVTLNGRRVGVVTDVGFAGEGVAVDLRIDEGEAVPRHVEAVVLRRSAIGEQALDLRPAGALEPLAEAGEVLQPAEVALPVDVQPLLERAERLLATLDPEDAATLTRELADAVEGRGDDLGRLLVAGGDVAATVAELGDDLDRLATDGTAVLTELAEHRAALSAAISGTASTAALLADVRADLRRLTAAGPAALRHVDDLLSDAGADIACSVRDLGRVAGALDTPERRLDLGEALRLNRWFFTGVEIGAPVDPVSGNVWNRTRVLPPQSATGNSYLPDKRPVPTVRPGGACHGVLGVGAPAARQPGWRPLLPETGVDAP